MSKELGKQTNKQCYTQLKVFFQIPQFTLLYINLYHTCTSTLSFLWNYVRWQYVLCKMTVCFVFDSLSLCPNILCLPTVYHWCWSSSIKILCPMSLPKTGIILKFALLFFQYVSEILSLWINISLGISLQLFKTPRFVHYDILKDILFGKEICQENILGLVPCCFYCYFWCIYTPRPGCYSEC